jgi:5'(3')-deoxyribonucleotidase
MPSKPKRDFILGVDLDGVVVDFYKAIKPVAAEWLGKNVDELPEQFGFGLKEWGVPAEGELSYKWLHRHAVKESDLFDTAPAIPRAAFNLRRLSDAGVHIRIITHRLYVGGLHEKVVQQTTRWLEKHAVPYVDLCFIESKTSINADLYIDDAPKNIEAFRAAGKEYLIFENATNLGIEGPRAKSWDEVYDYVMAQAALKK